MKRFLAAFFGLVVLASVTGCGDDGDDGGTTTGSSSSSSFTCCLNGSQYTCPDSDALNQCGALDPSACTPSGSC